MGDIQFDYSKLKGRIVEKFKTQNAFAEAMNISQCAMNYKLNGKSVFTQDEIYRACLLLDIPTGKQKSEVELYFFTPMVRK